MNRKTIESSDQKNYLYTCVRTYVCNIREFLKFAFKYSTEAKIKQILSRIEYGCIEEGLSATGTKNVI